MRSGAEADSRSDIHPMLHDLHTTATVADAGLPLHTRVSLPTRSRVKVVSSRAGSSSFSQYGQTCSSVTGVPPQKMHARGMRPQPSSLARSRIGRRTSFPATYRSYCEAVAPGRPRAGRLGNFSLGGHTCPRTAAPRRSVRHQEHSHRWRDSLVRRSNRQHLRLGELPGCGCSTGRLAQAVWACRRRRGGHGSRPPRQASRTAPGMTCPHHARGQRQRTGLGLRPGLPRDR
jgi:hypothetical protein